MRPRLTARMEHARSLPVLVWRFAEPRLCISSDALSGGIGVRNWVINATVPLDYARADPDRHLTEIGAALELVGTGCGLLTAVDVARYQLAADSGVVAAATVGLSHPTWAAAPDRHLRRELPSSASTASWGEFETVDYRPLIDGDEHQVGTINIVVAVPLRLSEAALVNAVTTATEAKVQALYEAGIRATGTASDAIVVHCPTGGTPQAYGGPRSTCGARIARAVHAAVLAGTRSWISDPAGRDFGTEA